MTIDPEEEDNSDSTPEKTMENNDNVDENNLFVQQDIPDL